VFRWINGHDPRQSGLETGLWTRAVVASLIARKFGIQLGRTAVGDLLAKLGLTPQSRCNGLISAIRWRLSTGSATPSRPLPGGPKRSGAKCISGMNQAFGRMAFMAGPGA